MNVDPESAADEELGHQPGIGLVRDVQNPEAVQEGTVGVPILHRDVERPGPQLTIHILDLVDLRSGEHTPGCECRSNHQGREERSLDHRDIPPVD